MEMAYLPFINILCICAVTQINHVCPGPCMGQGWTAGYVLLHHAPTNDFPWSMGGIYVTSLRTEKPESLHTPRSCTLDLCCLNKWYTYSLYFPSCILIMLIYYA